MTFKSSSWRLVSMIAILFTVSCSNADYGSNGGGASKNKERPGGENISGQSKSKPNPEFFSAGKSLDLHVIMDKSGSLFVDPKTRTSMGSGSDPTCKRVDALLDLIDGLRTKLTKGEYVRLTVVTFGNGSELVGSIEDVMKETRSAIDSKLRDGICEFPGRLETTHYAKGIRTSLSELKRLRTIRKLEVETSLFFSDGAAKDNPTELGEAIGELNAEFPNRVFGILLGNTSDDCSLSEAGRGLTTLECLRKVAGNVQEKVIQSNDAAGLSAAMTSLLEK